MPEMAIVELLLIVIAGLLAVIGWGGRKAFQWIKQRWIALERELERFSNTLEELEEKTDTHGDLIVGDGDTPWPGLVQEVQKHRQAIKNHGRRLSLIEGSPDGDDPADDLEDINIDSVRGDADD